MASCTALVASGARKGKECGRPTELNGYCVFHKKCAIEDKAIDEGTLICRRSTHGCTNIVPPEYVAKGIKTCEKHYKEQLNTDEVIFCQYGECRFPAKTDKFCDRHLLIGQEKEKAEAEGLSLCNTPSCREWVNPDVAKLCEKCREKKAEKARLYRAKKSKEIEELRAIAAKK